MNRNELRTWLSEQDGDAEVWQMTGTREYVIGEPSPEDGEAEFVGPVAEILAEVFDED